MLALGASTGVSVALSTGPVVSTWSATVAGSDTDAAGNWTPTGTPNSSTAQVVFGGAGSTGTVTNSVNHTYQSVRFTSSASYVISGGGKITFGGTTANLAADSGSHVIATPISISAGAVVMTSSGGAGTVTLSDNNAGSAFTDKDVTVNSGTLAIGATTNARQDTGVVIKLHSLTLSDTGTFDLTNHDMIIGNSNLAAVQNEILNAFGAGTGFGGTITSSTGLADGDKFWVAISADDLGITSWDNVNVTDPNSVIIKYTYFGDANLDGAVTPDDYAVLDGNFGVVGGGWLSGDVNLDGTVTADDYATLDGNFGKGTGIAGPLGSLSVNSVPEPASLFLLAVGSAGILSSRKRRKA